MIRGYYDFQLPKFSLVKKKWEQRDSIGGKALALHKAVVVGCDSGSNWYHEHYQG